MLQCDVPFHVICKKESKWVLNAGGCRVPEIPYGHVVNHEPSQLALHGERLKVECAPKHEIAEVEATIVCRNGTWSHMPTCIPGLPLTSFCYFILFTPPQFPAFRLLFLLLICVFARFIFHLPFHLFSHLLFTIFYFSLLLFHPLT